MRLVDCGVVDGATVHDKLRVLSTTNNFKINKMLTLQIVIFLRFTYLRNKN